VVTDHGGTVTVEAADPAPAAPGARFVVVLPPAAPPDTDGEPSPQHRDDGAR
jgi:hypothetical protein